MRVWIVVVLALVLGVAGCSTQERRNQELVETYLQAIVDGRLADAAALHTSLGDGQQVVPDDAYLAAAGRVDGFTVEEVTERSAQVTLHAGDGSRSGTIHVTRGKVWDTWVWSELSFTITPAFVGATVNGVPMPASGDVSMWAPAGSFEVTAEAGPLLTAFPRFWEFPLGEGSRGESAAKVLGLRLTDEGQAHAGRQLSAMLAECQDKTDARLAAGVALPVLVGLSSCGNTQETENQELVETYLEAIVDGRLADAASLHTQFDDDTVFMPREAYLAAEDRVDGFSIDSVDEDSVEVTLHAGDERRSGTVYASDGEVSDLWVWQYQAVLRLPSMADLMVNGVQMPADEQLVSFHMPAGSFEVVTDAGPFLDVSGGSWTYTLDDNTFQPSELTEMAYALSAEGVAEAEQQLGQILQDCVQDRTGFDPACPNQLSESFEPDAESVEWTLEGPTLDWRKCDMLDHCFATIQDVVISATWTEDGQQKQWNPGWVLGGIMVTIREDLTLNVEILGAE